MRVDLRHLSDEQKNRILRHIQTFRQTPHLIKTVDPDVIRTVEEKVRKGARLKNAEAQMLETYIANTYQGAYGDAFLRYLVLLGLPPNRQ